MRDSVLSDAADKHCIAYERTFRRINHRVQCLAIARVHAHISRGQDALGREERTRARARVYLGEIAALQRACVARGGE